MTSSGKEDEDQSKINGVEDSKTTIEFLRGRLLAERSASRTAKQRADELAQRVTELEVQLKVVSLQRKKAEKATAAVLSILEDHAIDDVSEEFSSGSDKETTISDSKDAENKTGGDISSSAKEKEDDVDTLSSSEIVSSSSTARSLSWKSGKSSHSLDRRKYTDSNRRRYSNFSSTDSPKRAGNSCRRIRRRDTRSASDKLQNSSAECASEALPSSANNEPHSLTTAGAGNSDVNEQAHVSALDVSGNGREVDKSDEDSQRALHQQAQVIGQYEAEEKAQREWEEKYRESNSCTPDSFDRENYSDMTEERDDLKASQEPCLAGRTSMQNHANKCGAADVPCTEQNENINNSPSTPHADMSCLEDKKGSRTVESDSPASEVAHPMSNEDYLENHGQTSAYSHQQSHPVTRSPMHPRVHTTSFSRGSSLQAGQALQTGYELALVSHNTSNGVDSVLGKLEQAKLSLTKQINSSLPTASYPVLPSRFSSVNHSPEPSTYEISLSPYVKSRSNYVTQSNRVTYPFQRAFPEVSSSAPSYRPISETNFDAGQPSSMRFKPNSSSRLPFSSQFTYPSYPKCPDVVTKLPSGEAFLRNFPTNETDLPPSFSFSTLSPEVVPRLPSTEVFSRNFPTNETDQPPSFSFSTLSPEVVPRLPSTEVFPRNTPTSEAGIPTSFFSLRHDPHIRPNMYRG